MASRILVDLAGWPETDHRIAGVETRAADARPVWDDVGDRFEEGTAEWFASEGEGTWSPLSPRYAAWKAREHPGLPMLVLHEADGVRASLTSGGSARYSIRRWDEQSAEYGTRDPVATLAVAQGRPPVHVDDALEFEFVQTVRRWVLLGEES